MERNSHNKEKKSLSASGMLKTVREIFDGIPPSERSSRGKKRKISLSDCLMSGLAMFSLKSTSLLGFDEGLSETNMRHNLSSLFGIREAPSDTYMREQLDEIDPRLLRSIFTGIFKEAQRGKLLEEYRFLNGYLLALDGTQIFESEDVHCEHCCRKEHKDGRITYHHNILAGAIVSPGKPQVIPLCPEPITKQDGSSKNDCERNASYRFLADLKREHSHLELTIVCDALSANAPYVNKLRDLGYDFILNIKPDGNRSLFNWVRGIPLDDLKMDVGKNRYHFRFLNDVPLNDTKQAPTVNFLECDVVEFAGKKEIRKHFTWVTSHKISKENVYQLMQGGRARWKIENETFNTLKNQGYQFEHNFGHGKQYLHTVFAFLMMAAFAIDQIQEAACGLFQAALKFRKRRSRVWEKLRSYFSLFQVQSWEDLFRAIGCDYQGPVLSMNTS